MSVSLKKTYIKALKEKKYFFTLLPEEGPRECRYSNCNHNTVKYSLLCAKHHFEMVTKLPCPWVVSEDGVQVIKVLSYYVMDYAREGAVIGARIGIILWLIQALGHFFNQGSWGVSVWLLFFIVLWGRFFLGRNRAGKFLPLKYVLPGLVVASFVHLIHPILLNVMLSAWKAHLIIAVIGVIMGIFPGMAIGAIVGVIQNKRENPPHEDPTGHVWVKGILLPTTCFSILLILYSRYSSLLSDILNITFL